VGVSPAEALRRGGFIAAVSSALQTLEIVHFGEDFSSSAPLRLRGKMEIAKSLQSVAK
jgi:hypothetical protein